MAVAKFLMLSVLLFDVELKVLVIRVCELEEIPSLVSNAIVFDVCTLSARGDGEVENVMFLLSERCAELLGLLSGEVLRIVSATVEFAADRGVEDNLTFCLFKVDCVDVDEMLRFERLDLL